MLKAMLLDLDGTLYRGGEEVPGAGDFVRLCNSKGIRCLFVTNRSNRTPETICEQLRGYGIPCGTEDVLTSGMATARYLGGGSAYCVGEKGLDLAMEAEGIRVTGENPDAVVVSFDRGFTYDKMATASTAVLNGARFVATNMDPQLKTEDGVMPGTGSIVASIIAATRKTPEVVGKPEPLIFEMALKMAGCTAGEALAVGDNLTTDIGAGERAGIQTALLLTGISKREDIGIATPHPTYIAEDFAELTKMIFNISTEENNG